MPRFISALAIALALPLALPAADWPQFLGPNRDSTSPETVAPWTGPLKPAWKQPVGDAHSSPVVAGGVVYAFYQTKGKEKGTDLDTLAAFDAATGERKWEKSYSRPTFTPPFGRGPRGTPVVDGGRVYTFGSTGVLACWDAKTGDVAWKVDALKEFKAGNLFFGVSTSPIVEGKTVVVMVGGKGHGIVAFDAATGKVAWTATDDPASYASPIAFGTGPTRQLAFLTGASLLAVSPAGEVLWQVPFKDPLNESSTTPVKAGDLLIGGSVKAGSIGLKLGESGGKPTAEKVWANDRLTCYFSTPVVVGPHVYMINGVASLLNPSVTLRCVEAATGKVLWEKPNVGRYHAALVRTGDDKLLMLDDNGFLSLLQPDPAGYKELCRSKVCGPTWAHPALVGGKVYLRDEKELICVDLK